MNIEYLAEHTDWIPQISRWFYAEWKQLYGKRTLEDVETSVSERANTDHIPCALVAVENGSVIGTISLKIHDMDTRMELSPWLAGLYVIPSHRGRGIGKILVKAIEEKAKELLIEKLYLYTPKSKDFYTNLGWEVKEDCTYNDVPVTLMMKKL